MVAQPGYYQVTHPLDVLGQSVKVGGMLGTYHHIFRTVRYSSSVICSYIP
jgi:hypothetical protein